MATQQHELSPAALRAIDLATKLFETRGCTEEEAQARTAKAMELLAAHNLDMLALGTSAKGAQRSDKTRKGGLYQWQRDLWKAVAELQFCVYFSKRGVEKGQTYEHRVVGRHENVIVAELMADYLQQTIERYTKERATESGYNIFAREMIAFREGMADRLVERLNILRRERLEEDKRKQREAQATARHSAAPGTALILADVIQSEGDLNNDYIRGWEPGTTAAKRAAQAAATAPYYEKAKVWQEDRAEFRARWPEEYESKLRDERWSQEYEARRTAEREAEALLEAKRQKRRDVMIQNGTYHEPQGRASGGGGYRYRADTPREARQRLRIHSEGRDAGDRVGLDPQVGGDNGRRLK